MRKLLREGVAVTEIINSFPNKKVELHEVQKLREGLRTNQYKLNPNGTKLWHCRSCDSWKLYNKTNFYSNGKGLNPTCKLCRNRRKKNKLIMGDVKVKIHYRRRWIRKKIIKIINYAI